ncbi:glycosyltransferase [Tellurirhabdus bombi]|uniref:glycosyltransferase n=1 Tax=Tellurirhabdus bombi TaxID=2907205 RepID=UPI001F1993C0|nr:glycosyltransferase [Tellurirhabdus bombi]
MRILHICSYTWDIGGPARMIHDHTQVAVAQGHQVDILSPVSPNDKPYPAPTGSRLFTCQRTLPISRFFREFSLELYQFLKKNRKQYDIIHCHGLWHWASIAPFFFEDTPPIVVTIHGVLDPWARQQSQWKKSLMDKLMQKKFLAQAQLIHVFNPEEAQQLADYFGYLPSNVIEIPNGIQLAEADNPPLKGTFRRQFSIPDTRPIVLFLSRINHKKGLDILLEGFRQIISSQPEALLVIAGSDDGYLAQTESFIQQYQLQDHIRLVGILTGEIKRAALTDATIFALPSYSEGQSMAVLEALLFGVPSLVSNRVGYGSILAEETAACVVETNPEQIAAGLSNMLQNEAYRQTLRLNAPRLIREKYDIEVVGKQLLAKYESVLSTKQPRAAHPATRS